jgi:hypothetical protein
MKSPFALLALFLLCNPARAEMVIPDKPCDAQLCVEDIDSVTVEEANDEQEPVAQSLGAQTPATQTPAEQAPGGETPTAQTPAAQTQPPAGPPGEPPITLGFRKLIPLPGFHFAGAVSTNAGLAPNGSWNVIPAFAMVVLQYQPTPKLVIFGRVTPNSANALSDSVWAPGSPVIQGIRYLTAQSLGVSPDSLTNEELSAGIQKYRHAAFGPAGDWSARLREFGIIYRPESDFIAEISLGRQDSPHVQAFADPGFGAYPFFSALRASITTKYKTFANGTQVALRIDAYSDAERSLVAFGNPIPGYIFARVTDVLNNPNEPALSYKRPSGEATAIVNLTPHAGFLATVGRRSYGNAHWDSIYTATTFAASVKKTKVTVQFMHDDFQNPMSPGAKAPKANTFNAQVLGPTWKSFTPKFETSILRSTDNSPTGIQGYTQYSGGGQYALTKKPKHFLGVNWSPSIAGAVGRETAQAGGKPVTILGGGLVLQFFK